MVEKTLGAAVAETVMNQNSPSWIVAGMGSPSRARRRILWDRTRVGISNIEHSEKEPTD